MRLFQNSGISRSYASRFKGISNDVSSFEDIRRIFLEDRYGAPHILQPVLMCDDSAFFTNGDDERLQRAWANQQGLNSRMTLEQILLGQIEHHKTEVFYNLDPIRYPSRFVAKLPGCVKRKVAWRAAPSGLADFDAYDSILCNFPSFISKFRQMGWRSDYFSPAHDPELDSYAANRDRPVDVLFVGGFSRHHVERATILDVVAQLRHRYRIEFRLDHSRLTTLAETPAGLFGPLRAYRRTHNVRHVSGPPVFGRQLYERLSSAKIVLNGNGAINLVGRERGNMRCWEAMGAGCAMLSDDGVYPEGMEPEIDFKVYRDSVDVLTVLHEMLENIAETTLVAEAGNRMIANFFSKERQWTHFMNLT